MIKSNTLHKLILYPLRVLGDMLSLRDSKKDSSAECQDGILQIDSLVSKSSLFEVLITGRSQVRILPAPLLIR